MGYAPGSDGPLAGVRVVEVGHMLAGPFCGQLLADLGADVVKIEDPTRGDPMRAWGKDRGAGPLWWPIVGRNKQSVCVDLRVPEGQALVLKLVKTADVLVENFRVGTLERWGLGYEALSAVNPGLVVARVTGYGQDGPYATRAGYGGIGEAMGGLRYVVGDPATPPSRAGIAIGDSLAALFATVGVLSALHERQQSGKGQVVDSAIYESVLAVMEALIPEYTIGGHIRERTGPIMEGVAPSNAYETKDGVWAIMGANQDSVFARLATVMGRPGLSSDVRFSTHAARGQHQGELDRLISTWTRAFDWADLERTCVGAGVPVGRMFRAPDMLADPHFKARRSVVTVTDDRFGEIEMQNVFPRLSRTSGRVRWTGRELGADTSGVLRSIGLGDDEIARLCSKGVVACN